MTAADRRGGRVGWWRRGIAVVGLLCAWGAVVQAGERYALVIGNNLGDTDELPLSYAHADAEKVAQVLTDLGDVRPENTIVLLGEDADTARAALAELNQRLATEQQGDATLIVYYSGHADAESLHLGHTMLPHDELEAAIRGSRAAFRLVIIDACRSGVVTQVKGGVARPQLPVKFKADTTAKGAVYLTASAASEDAQESDAISGSFFTHYLVSGLLGAADGDGDGAVDVDEAYRFAYDNTIRASSRSFAGVQHPTYRHELRGRGEVVLTRWRRDEGRALLTLPPGESWFVLRDDSEGPLVAEVNRREEQRTISVRPGRYFVRGRTTSALLEGAFTVSAGDEVRVADQALDRTSYARLARKGSEHGPDSVHSLRAGYVTRSPLGARETAFCHGGVLALGWELEGFTLGPRVSVCGSSYAKEFIATHQLETNVELRLAYVVDLPGVTLELGGGLGLGWVWQRFEHYGRAPDNHVALGLVDAGIGASVELTDTVFVFAEAAAALYLYVGEEVSRDTSPVASPVMRLGAGLGLYL